MTQFEKKCIYSHLEATQNILVRLAVVTSSSLLDHKIRAFLRYYSVENWGLSVASETAFSFFSTKGEKNQRKKAIIYYIERIF